MGEPHAERPQMPDYGVDGDGWEPLRWSWARERLERGRNYWVVTASSAGQPHALPVWGVWHEPTSRFAFSCGPRSRKARDLAANPLVAVAADDTVECVSLEGAARVVSSDDPDLELWIERYLDKYRPMSTDLSADFLRANVVVEVRPTRGFGVIEREDEFATRATRWSFD
jgi:nitroimidazol reductase NimA-like FMN-containing flavoprotein (pyridoxamine 5'-phosphate oxidase superfamily)